MQIEEPDGVNDPSGPTWRATKNAHGIHGPTMKVKPLISHHRGIATYMRSLGMPLTFFRQALTYRG